MAYTFNLPWSTAALLKDVTGRTSWNEMVEKWGLHPAEADAMQNIYHTLLQVMPEDQKDEIYLAKKYQQETHFVKDPNI